MPYYRAELGGNPPYEEGQGLDLTDGTLSLNVASTSEYGGAKVDGETIGINSQGQLFALQEQTITLSGTTSSVAVGGTDTITATASGGGAISATSNDTDVATVSVSNGEITIIGVADGSCTITVNAAASGQWGPGKATISVEVVAIHIYGAEWDGSSSPTWTRTDDAVGFADPNPYYSGMSETPSSPFDNLMPWSGMRIVEDSSAGTLVEIPKFWYKWTRKGSAMKLQISDGEQTDGGWYVSPAHADRGDGVGERDYAYVGRYHCSSSSYKSISGARPCTGSRSSCRTSIHNLGSIVWQNDLAMRWTISMLYLVEYANWDSQSTIGIGVRDANSGGYTGNMGYTDSMPYHTGITATSRASSCLGTQYRYIEGLWDNAKDWIDGVYFSGNSIYAINNPANFSESSGGTLVGNRGSGYGCLASWTTTNGAEGFDYVRLPSGYVTNTNYNTYICDYMYYFNSATTLCAGGDCNGSNYVSQAGLFSFWGMTDSSQSDITSRLMVLPPSRLSPPTD